MISLLLSVLVVICTANLIFAIICVRLLSNKSILKTKLTKLFSNKAEIIEATDPLDKIL